MRAIQSATRARAVPASTPRNRSGRPTFWATVFHGKSASRWKTKPSRGWTPSTPRPSSVMRPAVTGASPAMRPSRVDLPQPDGPTIDTNSPPLISNETSSMAVNSRASRGSANRRVTCSRTMLPVGPPLCEDVAGLYLHRSGRGLPARSLVSAGDDRHRQRRREPPGGAERGGDGDGPEADAERAEEEPEVAAEGVVQPAAGHWPDRHPQCRDEGDGAEGGPHDPRAKVLAHEDGVERHHAAV